jgi:hypothetical protein
MEKAKPKKTLAYELRYEHHKLINVKQGNQNKPKDQQGRHAE